MGSIRVTKLIITAIHPVGPLLSHELLIEEILRGRAPATVLPRLIAPLTTALALGAHSAPLSALWLCGTMLVSHLEDWIDLGHW